MTEAQKAAQKRYRDKNKEKYTRMSNKATAKVYIKSATLEELSEIKIWIKERMETKMEANKKYIITQEPYLTGPLGHGVYQATGIDQEGNEVMLTWEILEGYNPTDDPEELACDWDNPDRAEIIQDSKSYLEGFATGGEARQIPGRGCDYIIIKDVDGEEVAYAEELVPDDEPQEDANWNQARIDRLVAEIRTQLKEVK